MLLEIIILAVAGLALLVSGVVLGKLKTFKRLNKINEMEIGWINDELDILNEEKEELYDYLNIEKKWKEDKEFTFIKK